MKPVTMPKPDRLAFLDALAKRLGHVEYRNARESASHRWGYGPTLVWSASSGKGTLLVLPYSSGSGVLRVHVNRYSAESDLLGWKAEITAMPDELPVLVPWFADFILARSMQEPLPSSSLIVDFGDLLVPAASTRVHFGLWTYRATDHEREVMNARDRNLVKETL